MKNTATWLQNLAVQLVKAIRVSSSTLTQTGELSSESGQLSSESGQLSSESGQLIAQIFQCIIDNQGAVEPVYKFLTANQAKLNTDLLQVFPNVLSAILENSEAEKKPFVATLIEIFGNLIAQFPLGQRAVNIELAISAYEQALEVRTREAMPVKWATSMNNLAIAYYARIRGDRAENIEKAISAYEQTLEVRTRETMPVEWAHSMMNLANAYAARIRGNRSDNIEEAFRVYGQSLEVMTREAMPIEWAKSMVNLALAYSNRIRGDRAENIEEAIRAYEQALEVMTREAMPFEWATSIVNLALAYSNRIRGDRAENIEEAIRVYEQALEVMTREVMPFEWAKSMNNLALAYSNRIRGDRAENIEEAIRVYEQALEVRTREAMPIEWAESMMNLASADYTRIRGDRAENIENAIRAYGQALEVTTRESMPFEWAVSMMNLALAYVDRIRGDRAENIEEAIRAYGQALEVMTREAMPFEWATSMNNLASAYSDRIRGDRAENIEEAIRAYGHALEVMTREAMPFEWAESMMNLALAYSDRIRGDRAENIEEAIRAYQQALEVMTREAMPFEWATSMMNLASAYRNRIRGDRAENIETAISVYSQSLEVMTREAMPFEWATSMNNLANAYRNRVRGDRAENIEEAISAIEQSLEVRTREAMPIEWATSMNNLALAYSNRIRGDRAENIEEAINACEQALEVLTPDQLPNDCRRTAQLLGNLCVDNQHWTTACKAYELALQAMEILYQASLFLSSQEVELSAADDLFRRTAFAQAQAGDFDAAVVTLERGRARGLSDTLERDRADLAKVKTLAPDLYQAYQTASEALRQLEISERSMDSLASTEQPPLSQDELRQQAAMIRTQFRKAIEGIRQLPGYTDFLAQPDIEDIATAIQPDCPLVYVATTPNGSLALMARMSSKEHGAISPAIDIHPIWLDNLTESSLLELLNGSEEELDGWFRAYNNRYTDEESWHNTINQITHQLWDLLMGPVVIQLEDLGVAQAVLIPTGYLSFLPLHAAWIENDTIPTGRRYAMDTITFTYAPNARSLTAAQAIAQHIPTQSLLAINEPRPTTANLLPNSEREVEAALSYFPQQHQLLNHEQATREAVLAALPQHNILHFSCHGYANFNTPLDSGLLMANDELLTLRDFFNLQLQGIRLVLLSACETGLPGTKLPDEVISLPTGLLQAGVAGVIASLWSVADLSTMMLVVRFYHYWQTEKLAPPQALRRAQQWVRDKTNGEKKTYFETLKAEQSTQIPAKVADDLYKSVVWSEPDENDFAHPFYWAAFTYVGV